MAKKKKKKKAAKRQPKKYTPKVVIKQKDVGSLLRTAQAHHVAGSVEVKQPSLVIADPPYNMDQAYTDYDDKRPQDEYLGWCYKWMQEVHDTLPKGGAFWLFINDENAVDLDHYARHKVGLCRRNWVIWYYTFGVACQKSFSRSHTHVFHYTKGKDEFTFNADPIRVPSARQLEYNDKRANKAGKLPDNTWILRPQELEDSFTPIEDTWWFNRVCGTYQEREKHSPNQLPLLMIERIVQVSSNVGDWVCDPFGGTFTTAVAAAKNHRNFYGGDISPECVRSGRRRVKRELAKG